MGWLNPSWILWRRAVLQHGKKERRCNLLFAAGGGGRGGKSKELGEMKRTSQREKNTDHMNAGNVSCFHKPDTIKIWYRLEYIPSNEWWMLICFKEPKPQWMRWGEILPNDHLILYADWPNVIHSEHGPSISFSTSVFLTFICTESPIY